MLRQEVLEQCTATAANCTSAVAALRKQLEGGLAAVAAAGKQQQEELGRVEGERKAQGERVEGWLGRLEGDVVKLKRQGEVLEEGVKVRRAKGGALMGVGGGGAGWGRNGIL